MPLDPVCQTRRAGLLMSDNNPAALDPHAAFFKLADEALLAMKRRAEELKITGVAVVAYSQGERVESWSSKMLAVGGRITGVSQRDPAGANCLGIAYVKAAEMADTVLDSGSNSRPLKLGEFGWQGGVVARGKTGVLIASFSGGPSEEDVKVSRAGLNVLAAGL